jgi:nucleoid-associated protein YgaU
MKKARLFIIAVFGLSLVLPLAALSYDNNEFQQKSRAYSELAAKAYDDGQYEAAVEYARKAEESAALSAAFIEKMIARADAQDLLAKAHTRLTWAKEKRAEKFFPEPFRNATAAVAAADDAFTAEDYPTTGASAQKALDELSVVRETLPLPSLWKVRPWQSSRDCFWNIAKNSAVYGDPLLWKELYKANKKSLKQPSNPNLLMPGMMITIPSLKGEYREGLFDPAIKYDSFKSQTKR